MSGAVGMFLGSTDKVSKVVESGVVIQDTFIPVPLLVSPIRKLTISNAPPFIKNDTLAKELSQYGQLVSPIKMVSLGCKSPLLACCVSLQTGVHGPEGQCGFLKSVF